MSFSVGQKQILKFLEARKGVIIKYQTPDGKILTREVWPYVLGITTAGYLGMRAYQYSGGTRSSLGWKLLRLSRILSVKEGRDFPNIPPAGFNLSRTDKGLPRIIKVAILQATKKKIESPFIIL